MTTTASKLFFSFTGRIGRGPFWIGLLILIGLNFLADFVLGMSILGLNPLDLNVPSSALNDPAYRLSYSAMSLSLLVPEAALLVKRLHDRNRSFKWALPYLVLTTLGLFAYGSGLVLTTDDLTIVDGGIMIIAVCAISWLIIDPGLGRGSEGPNDYDEKP